jgi:membrane protease YdiL (CAAX protease family)
MKRLGQFLRSVIPSDPWQLVFLVGVVLLFVSPRLPWRTSAQILAAKAFPLGLNSDALLKNLQLVVAFLYPVTFAGLVAYLTCLYPGPKPVRRVIWFVFLPTLISLALVFSIFYRISRRPSSVFEPPAFLPLPLQWLRSNIWDFPVGLYFCVFSLLLILAFVIRLQFGKSSLPLVLPLSSISSDETPDSWGRTRFLILILLGPLFLLCGLVGLPLALPFILSNQSLPSVYLNVARIIEALVGAAVLIALALWILGQSRRNVVRSSFQLPEPRYAFFAFLLPIGLSGLLSAPDYLVARTNWAIYAFHQTFAPEFASYFDLSRVWDPWLLLLTFGAFAEEFVFRGLLLRKLMSRYGFHRGIFLTGIVWAAYHFRSDSYSGLSVGGVFFHLARRILICLAMNYVLAWMTLRWKSIIPAGIAHTVSNILVVAGINYQTPWSGELRILEWAVVAFLLFRYWSLAQTEPAEAISPPVRLESAI